MPTYVTLHNFTKQGIENIKDMPVWRQEIGHRVKALGINILAHYLVMGDYDEVVVWEAPTDEVAVAWLLELGSRGNRETTTLRAFTYEQFHDAINKLP